MPATKIQITSQITIQQPNGLTSILNFSLQRFTQMNEEAFLSNCIAASGDSYPDVTINFQLDQQNRFGQYEATFGSLSLTQINSYINEYQSSGCKISGTIRIGTNISKEMPVYSSHDFELASRIIAKTIAMTSHALLSVDVKEEEVEPSPTSSPIMRPANPHSFMFEQQTQAAPPLSGVATQAPLSVIQDGNKPRKKSKMGF